MRMSCLAALVLGCIGEVSIEGSACPCVQGFRCCENNRCISESETCEEERPLRLLAPLEGDRVIAEVPYEIRWQIGDSTGDIRITIDNWCDGDEDVIVPTAENVGSYGWTPPSSAYRSPCMRVSDNDDPQRLDQVDFVLEALSTRQVAGETWTIGTGPLPDSECSAPEKGCITWAVAGLEERSCDVLLSRERDSGVFETLFGNIACQDNEHQVRWGITGPSTTEAEIVLKVADAEFPRTESGLFIIE